MFVASSCEGVVCKGEVFGVGLWVIVIFTGGEFIDKRGVFFVGEIVGGDVVWLE